MTLLFTLATPQLGLAQTPAAGSPDGSVGSTAPALPNPAPGTSGSATPARLAGPVATASRLPPGMSVRARPGVLELLALSAADGAATVVAEFPLLSPTFETLYTDGILYLARGDAEILGIDVRDPMQPRSVVSFRPGGVVSTLWGGTGSLMIRLQDGSTILLDVSDPIHPRLQGMIPAPPMIGDRPSTDPSEAPSPPEQAQSRLAFSVRPFLFFANLSPTPTSGGAMVDFSYQYAKVSGLWWGIELAPIVFNSYYNGLPTFNSRVWFGYSGRSFGLAAALGASYSLNNAFVQLGSVARFGRLDGVHAFLRLQWSVLLPLPYPTSGEFTLEAPINRRVGLRYNFTGDGAFNGFHTTLGLQTYHGGDQRWHTTVLTSAVGFVYMQTNANPGMSPDVHHPGVMFSFTVEPRF